MLIDDFPAAGAIIHLSEAVVPFGAPSEIRIVADEAGRFDFGPQPAVRFVVVADKPHLTGAVLAVDLRDPTGVAPDDLRLVLHRCDASLHGTVRDNAMGVVPRARVAWGDGPESPWLGTFAGDDGKYELCVPPGTAMATAGADGYATIAEEVSAFGPVRRDLVLMPEALVRGRVVRASDHSPVADAVVRLQSNGRAFYAFPLLTTSDANGQFHFDGAIPGPHVLTADAGGLATERPVDIVAEVGRSREDIVCALVPAIRVSGKVVERDGGGAVPGASIMLYAQARVADRPLESISQVDGSFMIEGVVPGEYRLFIDRIARTKITVAKTDLSGVVVEIAALGSISGRVVHHGKNIDGVTVSTGDERANTDHDGRFTLRVPAGTHELYAESQRVGAFTRGPTVVIAAHEHKTGIELVLGLEGSVSGAVVDQNGAPVPSVVVSFTLVHGSDLGKATTADDGTFTARAMSGGGEYAFVVSRGDEAATTYPAADGNAFLPVSVADATTHVTGLRIAIRMDHLEIAGRVLDAAENPVPDLAVRAVPAGERDIWSRGLSASTDLNGRFRIHELARGSYDLYATSGDGDEWASAIAAGRTDVVIRLAEVGSIEGTLVGFPDPPQVYALLETSANSLHRGVVTGDTFRIRDLPVGQYRVMARSSERTVYATAVVTKGAAANVTLVRRPSGAIEGHVADVNTGAPLAGISCRTHVGGVAESSAFGRSDEQGAYEISGATPGVNSVSCGSAAARDVVVAVSKSTLADFAVPPAPRAHTGLVLEQQASKVIVVSIEAGGPAERAGLITGDVVQKIGSYPLTDASRATAIFDARVGATVEITIVRAGKQQVVKLSVEAA